MVNILVTGTPGTGKSTVARAVVDELDGYQFICVGDLVKEKALHEGRDDEWDSLIVNEDLVLITSKSDSNLNVSFLMN